jgi:hypothetical protein
VDKCKNYECREYTKETTDRCKLGEMEGFFDRCAKKNHDPSKINIVGKGIEKKRSL